MGVTVALECHQPGRSVTGCTVLPRERPAVWSPISTNITQNTACPDFYARPDWKQGMDAVGEEAKLARPLTVG